MRITGGFLKGSKILVPQSFSSRPSQDKIRKAIFDVLNFSLHILQPRGFTLRSFSEAGLQLVLDLYAGTGALGIEAVSRGAKHADFVEKDPTVVRVIRDNLIRLDLTDLSDVYQEKVQKFISNEHPQKYSLVFMDPPYNIGPGKEVWEHLPKLLSQEGIIVYLHGSVKGGNQGSGISAQYTVHSKLQSDANEQKGDMLEAGLFVVDERRYGGTTVTFLKRSF